MTTGNRVFADVIKIISLFWIRVGPRSNHRCPRERKERTQRPRHTQRAGGHVKTETDQRHSCKTEGKLPDKRRGKDGFFPRKCGSVSSRLGQ